MDNHENGTPTKTISWPPMDVVVIVVGVITVGAILTYLVYVLAVEAEGTSLAGLDVIAQILLGFLIGRAFGLR